MAIETLDAQKTTVTVFRTFFESVKANHCDALADTIAEDCEWVFIPDMKTYKGIKAVVELCEHGKLASDKTPEIQIDVATPEWGVFKYINRGAITKEATTGWQFPADLGKLIGEKYAVSICFVYQINEEGKIFHINEYHDMAQLNRIVETDE